MTPQPLNFIKCNESWFLLYTFENFKWIVKETIYTYIIGSKFWHGQAGDGVYNLT